ncbi:HU family DNA-binding protein [Lutibacter maritimus]|uniref:DNA-binding protein, histone-like, putative n=1 Tax=Lutibacter maritimus TaxID=593133 RepID=A0A1I6Q8F3_9FLAO|nr:HU family DNA-binding protein [Lutibacter maritimus]SFS48570.1 DNA-binding protein, histone-like, putative [Lutibacter maritimus]
MPIRYRITKRSNNIALEKKSNYIMQAVSTGTIDINRLSYEISNECTLSKVDVKAVLFALGEKLEFHLKEGKTIDIENIGKFKIGFKSIAAENAKDLTPKKSIVKYHLNFQPSVYIKRWLKKGLKTYKEGSTSN